MRLIFSFLLVLLFTQTAFADWPVKKKRVQFVPTYSFYYSKSYFDKKGVHTLLGSGNHYTSHYFSLYTMYGLTDRLDLLVNFPIANQRMKSNGVLSTKTGIADISVGLAYHFPSENLMRFFTLKGLLIIPGYSINTPPDLGYGSKGFQLGATYSMNPNKKTYIAAEANYTKYFDQATGPKQYIFSGTVGYNLNDFEQITFNFTHQLSISSDNSFSTNLATNKDFLLGKITLGYGKRITRTITPYFRFYFTPYGYNTGSAIDFSIYTVIKLP
jgi:hypothetical protein